MFVENLVANDCESYPNFFQAAFKNRDTGQVVSIEARGHDKALTEEQMQKLAKILILRTTFGFNNKNYDVPMMLYALKGKTCEQLNQLSDYIIENSSLDWMTFQKFSLNILPGMNYFDIQEPTPGVKISLKLYGGRIHSTTLQDLPIEPGTTLSESEMDRIALYCINDLDTTIDLYNEIEDRIELRVNMSKRYGLNLLSKSDAQIAEAVIKSELEKKNPGKRLRKPTIPGGTKYKYVPPEYISFESEQLNNALDFIKGCDFELDKDGKMDLPPELKKMKIKMGRSVYQLGIGGIHSKEKSQSVVPNENEILADRDVEAYYPNLILNLGIFPKHLDKSFLAIFKDIVDERLAAKKAGDKVVNESLKILINGTFGKLGSKWSIVFSPDLMIKVTLTGQLSILMLIERLEAVGIDVVSANTDGFVSLMSKDQYELYDNICFDWELVTNLDLEETVYKALYSSHVNSYLAVKPDGEIKGKGEFRLDAVDKNPSGSISITAAIDFIVEGTPIRETITKCSDIKQFICVRRVNGGATWRDQYLGKVVRWIYSTDGCEIRYKNANKTGGHNKVAKSDGARPVMTLGEFPKDIDYERYVEESLSMLGDLGLVNF